MATKKVKKDDTFLTKDGKKATLVTKEGLKQMKEELEYLKTEKREEVAKKLKEAISFGDLSENSEYDEAKNEQAFTERRIVELEEKIKNAKIIAESKTSSKSVGLGSKVKLKNLSKKEDEEYVIVGSTEADPFEGKISNESPVGNALLDHQKGDKVRVTVPGGVVEYEIVGLE